MAASNKTAALAGAVAALAFESLDALQKSHKITSTFVYDAIWLFVAAVFFYVPAYYFVLGKGMPPFGRLWFTDATERARYTVVARRMLAWFVGAITSSVILALVLVAIRW